jgi:acetyl esterase
MNEQTPARPPENSASFPVNLDADTRRVLARLTANPFLDPSMSIEQMRAAFEAFYAAMYADFGQIVDIENRAIAGRHGPIPIRIYTPREDLGRALPVLMFIHGGGSIMGSLDSFDAVCQQLCASSGCLVISIDYHLAPEHSFATSVEDSYDALVWIHRNAASLGGDPSRLAISGESGGGCLAAIVTQLAREQGGPPLAFQLLLYPYVGTRGGSRSMQGFARGYFFEADALDWIIGLNFPDRSVLADWRVSPIRAGDFTGLPPAFIVAAGADILRDDVEDYARLLRDAGVPTELSRYDTTIHGFIAMAGQIEAGRMALAECGTKLRRALRPEG